MSNTSLFMTTSKHLYNNKKYYYVNAGITDTSDNKTSKSRIGLVVDNSGSMGSNASNPNSVEKTNLTVLDIVKHTCKTIINTLNDDDELFIIKYSNKASLVLELIKMDTSGKRRALAAVDTIKPEGMTNIYDGIKMASDLLGKQTDNTFNTSIMLLSDGVPNIEPPKGTFLQFKKDIEDLQDNHFLINTFGFGYSVEVAVLKDIATLCNGSFNFIPDTNFVGTVIVNSLANTICNTHKNVTLSFELDNANYKFMGEYNINSTSWGFSVNVGYIKKDQPIHFVLECDENNRLISSSVSCNNITDNEMISIGSDINDDTDIFDIMLHYFRLSTVELITNILNLCKNNSYNSAKNNVNTLINEIESFINSQAGILLQSSNLLQSSSLLQLKGLLEDLNGQILEAVEQTNYKKWGEKYLNSLQFAHKLEICNNFKDPGVQFYGSDLFKTLQEKFEDIFITIPPPVAQVSTVYSNSYNSNSYNSNSYNSNSYNSVPVATAVPDMSRFYDRGGSCFHGSCLVSMNDGSTKELHTLRKGDITSTGVIECIVRTKCLDNKMQYCQTDTGLLVTKYHPIKINNNYIFPVDLYPCNIYDSEYMYSVTMEKDIFNNRSSTIVINNIECVTLGHGILNDPIASHDFFGNENIIDCLKCCRLWESGLITFNSGLELFERDLDTDKVNNINLNFEIILN